MKSNLPARAKKHTIARDKTRTRKPRPLLVEAVPAQAAPGASVPALPEFKRALARHCVAVTRKWLAAGVVYINEHGDLCFREDSK